MSIILPIVDLSLVAVNAVGTISWEQQAVRGSIPQVHDVGNGAIQVYNESGCGLSVTLHQSNESNFIPAGGWREITLEADDVSLDYVVSYIIPNAIVNKLIVVYYKPSEARELLGILGNSPIGVSGSLPTSVTQVIQDGQASGGTIVESTPTATPQTILMTTDGKLKMAGQAISPVFLWRGTCGGGNIVVLEAFPTDVGQAWEIIYRLAGDLSFFEATSAIESLRLKAGNGISVLGGQTAVGPLGTSVNVAQTAVGGFAVTTTTQQTVIAFTTTATGIYRLSVAFEIGRVGTSTISLSFQYTSPNIAGTQGDAFFRGGTAISNLGMVGNTPYETNTVTIAALTGTVIDIFFTDATVTVNDHVYAIIERLQ